ncbi:MAG: GNAT family N-acetyltransferase [Bryobacteraceae bacterium]|nr:GNAT family N-acetyltransferase [Bryobacteraceae bacterium]
MKWMHFGVVEENLRVAMRCYSRVNEYGEARDYPGVSVAYCGLSCAVFNSALLNAPASEDDFQRALTLASIHFNQRGVGWTFWLCEDLLTDPATRKKARLLVTGKGLDPLAQPPGMYAERLMRSKYKRANLDIRRVTTGATRLDFAHLSSVIFALPFATSQQIYSSDKLWLPPMSGWVGYLDGQAVTLACVVIGAGVSGVYSVGTLPSFQGRGFAETVIRHALAECRAEAGSEATVLQSTTQGLNLYTRMGYKPVTRFGVYMYENWRRN